MIVEFGRAERLEKTSVTCYVSNETNDSSAAIHEVHSRDGITDVVRCECVWSAFKCVLNSNSRWCRQVLVFETHLYRRLNSCVFNIDIDIIL